MNSNSKWWLIFLLLWLGLGTFLCWKYLCKKNADISAISSSNTSSLLWSVADGDFKQSANGYHRFLRSNSNLISPNLTEVDKVNSSVTDYIKSNNQKGLNVVGYYRSDEVNDNTFYANLGLARANTVKQQLINVGIPSKQITTSAQLLDGEFFEGDTLLKGSDFSFFTMEDNISKLEELKTKLKANPITLYFKTNSNELDLSADQQQQFADIIYYLDNVSDAKLDVSGHTDNVGNKAANTTLSKERAEFVKSYLTTKGNIASDRMDVNGFGHTKPIADNGTEEGKSKNRRVEVILK